MLELSPDVSAASWIVDEGDAWTDVALFGPSGFDAYCRLRFFPDAQYHGQSLQAARGPATDVLPPDPAVLAQACEVLAAETATPELCYFAMWTGYGTLAAPGVASATFRIPNREYYLFQGQLSDVGKWGVTGGGETQSAAFIWPADRAWCIACDTDALWAGIGASRPAIHNLMDAGDLDVVAARRGQPVPFYQ